MPTKVELEKIRVAVQQQFPADENVDVTVAFDHCLQDLVVMVKASIWAESQEVQRVEFSWPADWWQHLKQRWMPKWAKKKWPVGLTKKSFDVRCIYPDFKPAIKDYEYRLMLHAIPSLEDDDHA